MGDVLVGLLELATVVAAATVYGTPARPRPRYLRLTVRLIALGGAIGAMLILTGVFRNLVPTPVTVIWALCGLILLLAEHELGNRWISLAAWGSAATLLVVALLTS